MTPTKGTKGNPSKSLYIHLPCFLPTNMDILIAHLPCIVFPCSLGFRKNVDLGIQVILVGWKDHKSYGNLQGCSVKFPRKKEISGKKLQRSVKFTFDKRKIRQFPGGCFFSTSHQVSSPSAGCGASPTHAKNKLEKRVG